MPNVVSPTERWFINLKKLQDCMKNLNHLTDDSLKKFSKQTLITLITSDLIKGNLAICCQHKGIGLVPDSAFADMNKDFFFFLEKVGLIPIETSLRFQIYSIAVKHKPELIHKSVAQVMAMTLNGVFGTPPLNSNLGKKELDFVLNQITPDDFYPTDGSFLDDGSLKLTNLVKKIIS